MEFSPQQDDALCEVAEWLRNGDQQVFRLFGFAGTGKTTLAKHFAEGVEGHVEFCAFTGKAAYVLRQKGCPNASTIHSLIYRPKDKSASRLKDLLEEKKKLEPKIDPKLEKAIKQEKTNLARPAFSLNLESDILLAKLVVVDEVSMVDERMAEDLLSFGVKILVLGDPAQLPPVMGEGYFVDAEPDFMLTEIHRQAKDDPIIHLATQIRQKVLPDIGTYGVSRVRADIDADLVLECDQMLVGRNRTRLQFNQRTRTLLGRPGLDPVVGDRLVCLRNDHEVGLLNGGIWHVLDPHEDFDQADTCMLTLQDESDDQVVSVEAHRHYFQGRELAYWDRRDFQEFDYGYALTCHKSQGSQWDHVVVWDESACFRQDRWRWLYTAVTRAAKRIDLVVRNG